MFRKRGDQRSPASPSATVRLPAGSATRIRYSGTMVGKRLRLLAYVFQAHGRAYVLTFTASETTFARNARPLRRDGTELPHRLTPHDGRPGVRAPARGRRRRDHPPPLPRRRPPRRHQARRRRSCRTRTRPPRSGSASSCASTGPARACSARRAATKAPDRARWVVDPIDGTQNFVRGVPVWATLIALEREGEPVVAVASAPALRRRWWASRGGGAFADGETIRVSHIVRLEDASISVTSPRAMARAGYERQYMALSHALVVEPRPRRFLAALPRRRGRRRRRARAGAEHVGLRARAADRRGGRRALHRLRGQPARARHRRSCRRTGCCTMR